MQMNLKQKFRNITNSQKIVVGHFNFSHKRKELVIQIKYSLTELSF